MPARKKTSTQRPGAGTLHAPPVGVPDGLLGPLPSSPPKRMDAEQKRAWKDLAKAGHYHLTAGDVVSVELAAILLARVRAGAATAAECSSLASLLSKLGLEPQARQHVQMRTTAPAKPAKGAKEEPADPAHRYGLY